MPESSSNSGNPNRPIATGESDVMPESSSSSGNANEHRYYTRYQAKKLAKNS